MAYMVRRGCLEQPLASKNLTERREQADEQVDKASGMPGGQFSVDSEARSWCGWLYARCLRYVWAPYVLCLAQSCSGCSQ